MMNSTESLCTHCLSHRMSFGYFNVTDCYADRLARISLSIPHSVLTGSKQSQTQKRKRFSSLDLFSPRWKGMVSQSCQVTSCPLLPLPVWLGHQGNCLGWGEAWSPGAAATDFCYLHLGGMIYTLGRELTLQSGCKNTCGCVKSKASMCYSKV